MVMDISLFLIGLVLVVALWLGIQMIRGKI